MNNNRNSRIQSAQQTLEIIENKGYERNGTRIDLTAEINTSVQNTKLYSPDELNMLLKNLEQKTVIYNEDTIIRVENCTAMDAAGELLDKGKIGCLNFASAKNPGGGFLGGAQAQEESLARASTLYVTQMKYFKEMYEYNRSQSTYLYSDFMVYSPDVVFFKNDSDALLDNPYKMDILTSPAVNIGAMMQNNPAELSLAEETMMSRIDKMLAVFLEQRVDNLILGAWGCGVFRNNPENVARYFGHYLLNGGKYAKCFKNIVFATFDRSKDQENITAFKAVFE